MDKVELHRTTTDNDVHQMEGNTVKKRTILALAAAGAMVFGLAACAPAGDGGSGGGEGGLIGVAMPTKSS